MRDGAIMEMQRKNTHRDGVILAQFEFLKTRQEAMENAMVLSTWQQRLRWFFKPRALLAVVDAIQLELIRDAQRDMAEQTAKKKIEVVQAAEVHLRG